LFDIIAIGDTSRDLFVGLKEAHVSCSIIPNKCQLMLNYADKIPVTYVKKLIGGNSSNNAIGSRRLGMKSAYYTTIGNDDIGREIFNELKKEKVSTRYIAKDKKQESNFSTILNYKAERTILIYHIHRKYKLPQLDKSKWVYLSSMGKSCESIYKDLIRYLKKYNAKLAFNPGTHQIRSKRISKLISMSETFFLNKEEYQTLFNDYKSNIKQLMIKAKKLGPKIVVLTDGPKGSYCYDGYNFYFQKIYPAPIVERTGVGDSYSTAFVAALFYGKDVKEAMAWGTINAASVVQFIGPHQGLMHYSALQKIVKRHPRFHPVKY